MKTVRDIIDSKPEPVNIIRSTDLVIDALHMLNAVNLSYLIVKDGDTFKGIFSERDYSRNILLKGRSSDSTTIGEAMTTDLPVVDLNDPVEQCMKEMTMNKTRYLLAYSNNRFEGVITIHDLLRLVIANKEKVFDDTLAQKLIDTAESGGRIY